ncbi:hypothetical protein [Brenneria corticis]|uniref:hypothetical protein n=1 Tax=Brenneria corticis TaxID=2173106 RepID=UPI00143CF633|nr:hypothetical protein [Brenneria sp. CFCC 11842]
MTFKTGNYRFTQAKVWIDNKKLQPIATFIFQRAEIFATERIGGKKQHYFAPNVCAVK